MSFFGFNSNLPKDAETIDFQDTYEGFGEELEGNDQFNDETFGGDMSAIGKDFNFGSQSSAAASKVDPQVSYAQAVNNATKNHHHMVQSEDDDGLKPLDSLWDTQPQQPSKKVLSLEELEAGFSTGGNSGGAAGQYQQQPQQPMMPHPQGMYPPTPYGYGAPPPPGFNFNGYGGYPNQSGGFAPPPMMGGPPPPGGFAPPMPNNQNYMYNQPSSMGAHQSAAAASAAAPPPPPPPQQTQGPLAVGQSSVPPPPPPPAHQKGQSKELDLNQFPLLGSNPPTHPQHPIPQNHQNFNDSNPAFFNNQENHQRQQDGNNHNFRKFENKPPVALTPEEEEKLNIKGKKLEKIIKYSNIMTPRDRDFVTRFQISQIVTDDPYNEDFYFQIFKAIRSQNTHDGSLNSIAKYYLEHSGHRLGGKHKRADVALQRMQQQVSKAVTVAKERPKNSQYSKEGSLGKISFGSGKTPRKQLEILKKEIKDSAESADGNAMVNSMLVNFDDKNIANVHLSKKIILNCLEKTYENVLKLESQEKNHEQIDATELWNSLYISTEVVNEDGERISGKIDELKENIFVSYLNYEKGIKLFPRLLRYFSSDQKSKMIENFFKKISLLKLLDESSYEYYYAQTEADRSKIDKKVELFSNLILKFIIAFISNDLKFNEIVKLIITLINYNGLVKLLPNKIGLTLITILVSKIELIRQDINIMSSDLIIWTNVYDKLFNNLISKLINVFPKQLYINDEISWIKEYGQDKSTVVKKTAFDDSYIWHFLASLALAGKLQHQRIIVDEVREKVFECVEFAKKLGQDASFKEESIKKLGNLNLFLNVMGLNASESGDITELK
ncbi:Pat1 protein [Saccharomycopsis crataegensis]|uniref:Pat1 protein n=1 Tax=Saccharomycopsis crataegensis TaxID=43959 RepID=A0AAV5QQ05_9ASCO|nr:Pat1 protein [Saccharomycopsis crataegensis]